MECGTAVFYVPKVMAILGSTAFSRDVPRFKRADESYFGARLTASTPVAYLKF